MAMIRGHENKVVCFVFYGLSRFIYKIYITENIMMKISNNIISKNLSSSYLSQPLGVKVFRILKGKRKGKVLDWRKKKNFCLFVEEVLQEGITKDTFEWF